MGKFGMFDTEAERDAWVAERDRSIALDAIRLKGIGIKDDNDLVAKFGALCDLFERFWRGGDLVPGCDDPMLTSDASRAAATRVLEIMQGAP